MVVSAIVCVYVNPPFCENEDNFWFWCLQVKVQGKGKVHPRTGHESPKVE